MHAALLMAETTVRELPAAAPVYGIIAFGLLIGLLLVTFAFRSVGTRH